MKKGIFYTITIKNFDKHQKGLKRGHKAILISTGFLSDSKIRMLSPGGKLLFLSLLLLGGESTSSQIEVSHDSLCFQSGVKSGSIHSQLTMLQELQLVTVEKNEVLNNRNEIKVKEIKVKERKRITVPKNPDQKLEILELPENPESTKKISSSEKNDLNNQELRKKIRESYAKCYFERYKVDVVFNKDFNSKIKSLSLRLGEEAIEVVKFYLSHNDSWYLKSTHSIGLCLRDCESLRTQMLRGKAITTNDIRRVEKMQQTNDLQKAYEKGGF